MKTLIIVVLLALVAGTASADNSCFFQAGESCNIQVKCDLESAWYAEIDGEHFFSSVPVEGWTEIPVVDGKVDISLYTDNCGLATPNEETTWSTLKSLYR